ncbi:UDP-N-acetylmuramoyl-tripeptide--D-alanyl-D-alanine ligase [Sandaracinobacter neustonicus]|uniref:UDP-N-acetylmuramoyl-tripeptide--D-alanyl-D-alanine ligase n=1 Tax=Sandaracinobacter neustonicus TaxID=1715348 RepID=A0A501XGX4_9SPHN|nr:UDP-N-acetylmuramoyl-tripeptide--D-alanyl-D-alanine ligase [Sandaracinobacter neustonicus]TPE59544.1 UDP-N-acetylmuramoyl-tripeptide--D-alanyl-D-alanine ligase [Sandaracinobacter neustonicus]
MSALWTGAEIAAATGGVLSAPFDVDGVTFDSREVIGGELFVAMRGEQADGHEYVAKAAERGAAGFIVERAVDQPHVRVTDSFTALEALGAAGRARTNATIIGVTGSVGKTGTKEALRLAFERIAPEATHASVKSYNNHTGVPLSLARMPAPTRFGVFEMGMNHVGELAGLTRLVRPHIALITWVTAAHIAHFPGGEAEIAAAKAEIFEGLQPGGTAIFPADSEHAPLLAAAAAKHAANSISFGWKTGADVRVLQADIGPVSTTLVADVMGDEVQCTIGMAGRHWVNNALAVLAAVKAAGGDLAEAGLALAGLTELPGRGARVSLAVDGGTATLIDESYNANPLSMAAALAVLRDSPAKRRLAVLGAMRELGAESDARHGALAAPITEAGVADLALVGPEMAALKLAGASHLPDAAAALAWARATLRDGDVLLIKGSNSVGLGKLVAALKESAR